MLEAYSNSSLGICSIAVINVINNFVLILVILVGVYDLLYLCRFCSAHSLTYCLVTAATLQMNVGVKCGCYIYYYLVQTKSIRTIMVEIAFCLV